MAIGPTFEKGEPTEADVQHHYDKARAAALFLVEKIARQALREHPEYIEFCMSMGCWGFVDQKMYSWMEVSEPLLDLFEKWDDSLKLSGEPMRFTADGPVRREW
jgi:hypothetical protein